MIYFIGGLSVFNLIIIGLFLWMFFSGRLEIKTKKLIVVDKKNVERIHLDPNSTDVRVFGKVFQRRSPISGLVLFNTKGDENGGFGVMDDGTVSVTLDSYEGDKVSERASMFVMSDGNTGFLLKDIDNNTRFKAQLTKEHKVDFKVFDKEEKELKSFIFE